MNKTGKIATKTLSGLAFALMLACSMQGNAFAETYTPTLDEIKSSSASYLTGTHGHYTLSTTSTGAAGEQTMRIGGTTYYFTPDESTSALNESLKLLAHTGHAALVAGTSDNYVFTDGTNYWTYDTAKLPVSAWVHSAGTSTDYDYTSATVSGGVITPTYEKFDFKDREDITWSDKQTTVPSGYTFPNNGSSIIISGSNVIISGSTVSGAVRFKLPADNGNYRYYTYNYTAPAGYSLTQSRITSVTAANVQNKVFAGINVSVPSGYGQGGAIYNTANKSTINILADFIGNSSSGAASYGGAIYNSGTIGDITGDFIGNSSSGGFSPHGGAISNFGTIGNIVGDFIGNSSSSNTDGYGGAIYNNGINAKIGDIVGDFIGNSSYGYYPYGGAIYNSGTIGDITGDFIGNSSSTSNSYGGAIYNTGGTIGDIVGDFIGNSSSSYSSSSGGAIYNTGGTIGDIVGDFIGNSSSSYYSSSGGAIYNTGGTIGDIVGDFIGNSYSSSYSSSYSYGGAIYNEGTIGTKTGTTLTGGIINANFLNNYAKTSSTSSLYFARGGAIYTTGNMNLIADGNVAKNNGVSTISGNYVEKAGVKDYEAIYVDSTSATFQFLAKNGGKFIVNDKINGVDGYTLNFTGDNKNEFNVNNTITGAKMTVDNADFNHDLSGNGTMDTDALNTLTINSNADFGFKIDFDATNLTSDKITTSNTTELSTGTVLLEALNVTGDFTGWDSDTKVQIINNSNTSSTLQLALADAITGTERQLSTIAGTTTYDTIAAQTDWNHTYYRHDKDATIQYGTLNLATTKTANDSIGVTVTRTEGGVTTDTSMGDTLKLVTQADIGDREFNATTEGETYTVTDNLGTVAAGKLIINGKPEGAEANGIIDFNSHNGFALDNDNTELVLEGVELKNANKLVTGTAETDVKLVLDNVNVHDNGQGISTAGNIEIKGNSQISDNISLTGSAPVVDVDGTDVVTLDGMMLNTGNATLNITNGTVNLGDNAQIVGFDTTLTGTNLNIANENSLVNLDVTFNDANNFNMANDSIGTLAFNNLNLNGVLNMQVDADLANEKMDKLVANTATIGSGGAINVDRINILSATDKKNLSLIFTSNADLANAVNYTGEGTIAYSPIYKYDVGYDKMSNGGYFTFVRHGIGTNSGDFNPAVLTESATSIGAAAVLNNTISLGFQNADAYMAIPYLDRLTYKMRNRYALNAADASDAGANPLFVKQDKQSVWVKPYTTFENVPLENGPRVSSISYGTLIGFDTDLKELRHGWDRVITGFVGYNGASQGYSNVDTYQNGGIFGGTVTMYKGDFFNATTLAVGASVGENKTMYGTDHNTTLLSGIGNKTGYNFEFKDGKFIIQPSLTMSYNFIKTFNYTNAAGVRMESNPINSIQLQPGLRFIGNLKNGWQPYASVSMVWNVMGKSHVTADGTRLPDMSIKPYVQYGVGVQKTIKDHFMAFGQAMIQNGGRNGISLSGGMRWAIGHDRAEKVQKENAKQAKVIKTRDADKNIKNVCETKIQKKQELTKRLENNNNQLKTILKVQQEQLKQQSQPNVKRSFSKS